MIPLHLVGAELRVLHQAGKLGGRIEVRGPLEISISSEPVGFAPPQASDQALNNRANRVTLRAGRGSWKFDGKIEEAGIPNRTDLGPEFQLLGRGFGFRGLKGRDSGLPNQDEAGQRLFERGGQGELRYDLPKVGTLRLAGFTRDRGDRNPALDPNQFDVTDARFNPNGDSSIDFGRNHRQRGWSGELSRESRAGAFRIGGALRFGSTADRFQLTPGSQLALNWMAANHPELVGNGRFLFEDPFETTPLLDEQGNPVYSLDAGAGFPTLRRDRTFASGQLRTGYARNLGRLQFEAEAGVSNGRLDDQIATVVTGSVRVQHRNLALQFGRFADPVTAETLGNAPLTAQVDPLQIRDRVQLEWQDRGFSAKLSGTTHRNPFETRLAFPGTQLPYAQLVRFDRAVTREFTAAYRFENVKLQWTNSLTFGQGNDANGLPVTPYPTIGRAVPQNQVALTYDFTPFRGTAATLVWNYQSGLVGTDLLGDGSRVDSQSIDFEISRGNFRLGITNLLDDRLLLSFNQFPGTQFQAGRLIWISYAAKAR